MITQTSGKPMIGFTGTNGKTTSILITSYILEHCGLKATVLDSWKGIKTFLHAMEQAKDSDCLLAEVPVDVLRLKHVKGSIFTSGALTNISLDHLATCRTPENYAAVKSAFFNQLPKQAKAVINADDPVALALAQEGHVEYLSYALDYQNAMIIADNIRRQGSSTLFDLTVNSEFTGFTNKVVLPASRSVRLSLLGNHNVANALLAATISLLFVPDLEAVTRALSKYPGSRRNMEVIVFDQYNIIDDAARNPAAIHAALSTIQTFVYKRVLLLHGIYGGGGKTINQCNARELSAWFKKNPASRLFVTRSMYHCKSKFQVRLSEEKAFLEELKENDISFAYYPDLPDAIDSIMTQAEKGDLILLLGGPVLNRARDLLTGAAGGVWDSHTLVPSEITPAQTSPYAQGIYHNPT